MDINTKINAYLAKDNEIITNYANLSAILYEYLEDVSWVGFYILKNEDLYLGPFQGKAACMRIKYGKGVCGTSLKEKKTILVPDVSKFSGHIACSSLTKSEIVIPVFKNNQVISVLDIDSNTLNRFTQDDQIFLENIVKILEKCL